MIIKFYEEKIQPVNLDLLAVIREHKNLSKKKLNSIYPDSALDFDLDKLVKAGNISLVENLVTYIKG